MTSYAREPKPCECGCGVLVRTEGRRFKPGHFHRVLERPSQLCDVLGCGELRQSQAPWSRVPYCRFHYTRLYETGDLALQPRPSAWDRFVDKVRVLANDCWEWTGGGTGRGHVYGQFWHDGRNELAHRFAYTTMVGPVPNDLEIDHLCRFQRCVNPAHLEPVTPSVNMRRMHAAKKGATK